VSAYHPDVTVWVDNVPATVASEHVRDSSPSIGVLPRTYNWQPTLYPEGTASGLLGEETTPMFVSCANSLAHEGQLRHESFQGVVVTLNVFGRSRVRRQHIALRLIPEREKKMCAHPKVRLDSASHVFRPGNTCRSRVFLQSEDDNPPTWTSHSKPIRGQGRST
jgi:hypothetical protein